PNDVRYQAAPHTDYRLFSLIHPCPARDKLTEDTESNNNDNQNNDQPAGAKRFAFDRINTCGDKRIHFGLIFRIEAVFKI
ncbi:MAG: hypothetical protein ACJAZE_001737, partial [Halioglobus sp.]